MSTKDRIPVRNTDTLRKALIRAHATLGTWRKVAAHPDWNPVPAGTLCTFAKDGYLPKKWHFELGLPAHKPAPVCSHCGEVHVSKRCTARKRKYKDLFSIPVEELRYMIQNREKF